MLLAKVLKQRRAELGYTLLEIATKMEVSEATVQRWESGNIKTLRYDRIAKLAEILKVQPNEIMGWEDDYTYEQTNNSSPKTIFNIRLKELRTKKGISQQKLADRIGISKSSINMYERGEREPNIAILIKMADVFQTTVDYLIGNSNNTANNFSNLSEAHQSKCIKVKTIQERLIQIMTYRNLRQVDIINMAQPYCEKYGGKLTKTDLTQYISGKTEPNQIKLLILAETLNVNEVWLMGYDVTSENEYYSAMEFKDIIKNRRKELDLTLEEIGNAVGVAKATVLRWESGEIQNIRKDKIVALANVLKLSVGVLMNCETTSEQNQINIEHFSDAEKIIIYNFREKTNMQAAILKLLDINQT